MHRLFLAEFKRAWIEFKRYPAEAVTGVVTFTAVFLTIFLGAKYMAGASSQFGTRLDAIIVGYLLWSLSLIAVGSLSYAIQTESQTGTLEQVYLSPFGPMKVFLIRAVASLLFQLTLTFAVLLVVLLITQRRLHITPAALPPMLTAVMGSYALGFMLGGLALVAKRVSGVLHISQFVLLFLVMTPMEGLSGYGRAVGYLLPIAPSAGMLRDVLARGQGFNAADFGLTFANAVAYLGLGLLLFGIADRYARTKGVIGSY